jgi:hypothetical protein
MDLRTEFLEGGERTHTIFEGPCDLNRAYAGASTTPEEIVARTRALVEGRCRELAAPLEHGSFFFRKAGQLHALTWGTR